MAPASDSGERRAIGDRYLTIDRGLQTIGGILLVIVGYFTKELVNDVGKLKLDQVELRAKQQALLETHTLKSDTGSLRSDHEKLVTRFEARKDETDKIFKGMDRQFEQVNAKLDKILQKGGGL